MAKGKGGKKNATKHKPASNRAPEVSTDTKQVSKSSRNDEHVNSNKNDDNVKAVNKDTLRVDGKVAAPIVEAPKEQRKYSRRVLTSNWEKYVEPIIDPHEVEEESSIEETKEFSYLLQNAGAVTSHFKFEDERKLEEEMQKNAAEDATMSQGALGLNLNILASELSDINLQKKLILTETLSSCSYCLPSVATTDHDISTVDNAKNHITDEEPMVGDSVEQFVWCYEGLEQCKSLLERSLKWPQREKGEKSWEDLEFDDMVIVDDVAANNGSQAGNGQDACNGKAEAANDENTFTNIQSPVSPGVEEWSKIEPDVKQPSPTQAEFVDAMEQSKELALDVAGDEEEDLDDFLDELLSGGVGTRSVVIDQSNQVTCDDSVEEEVCNDKEVTDSDMGLTDSQISSMADSAADLDLLLSEKTENLSISANKNPPCTQSIADSQSESKSNTDAKQQDLDDWLDSILD